MLQLLSSEIQLQEKSLSRAAVVSTCVTNPTNLHELSYQRSYADFYVSSLITLRRTSTNVVADKNTLRIPRLPDRMRHNLTQSELYCGPYALIFPTWPIVS